MCLQVKGVNLLQLQFIGSLFDEMCYVVESGKLDSTKTVNSQRVMSVLFNKQLLSSKYCTLLSLEKKMGQETQSGALICVKPFGYISCE